eukprot:4169958-Prymnesium_polylepis.1
MGNVRVDRNHTTYTSTSVSEMLHRRDQGPPCARPNRPIRNRPMQYGGKTWRALRPSLAYCKRKQVAMLE